MHFPTVKFPHPVKLDFTCIGVETTRGDNFDVIFRGRFVARERIKKE